MKAKFWTSEKLLSLTALLVSLITLIVFVYQTKLIRQQQYASVYPYLALGNEYSGTFKYKYILVNEGIGPAIIDEIKVYTNETEVYGDVIDYVDAAMMEEDSIWYVHSNLNVGKLVPAEKKIFLIQVVGADLLKELGIENVEDLPTNTLNGAKALHQVLNNDSLTIEITYSSIYGETWVLRNGGNPPQKID